MNTLTKVFLSTLVTILLSCNDNNNKRVPPKKIDTSELKTPVPVPKLTILEKDLSINATALTVNEKQTQLRRGVVDMYKSQLLNSKLSKTERDIIKEKLVSAEESYDQSLEEKKKLEDIRAKLEAEIEKLKKHQTTDSIF